MKALILGLVVLMVCSSLVLGREVQITTVEDLVAGASGGMIKEGPDAGLIVAPGDTLVLEPGSYQLTETVKVTLPDLTIRARGGRATTQIDAKRVVTAIEIAADGVAVGGATAEQGLVIRGAKGPGLVVCAEQATEDITIQNNLIIGHGAEGVLIKNCQHAIPPAPITNIRILNNEVRANRGNGIALIMGQISDHPDAEIILEGNTIDGQLGAGILLDTTNVELKKNRIVRNRIGVLVKRAAHNRLRGNTIAGNLSLGVDAAALAVGEEIDATENFWGDVSGPFHSRKNPLGKGDRVTDGVKFDPWTGKRPEDRITKFQLTSVVIPEQARVNYPTQIKATVKNIGNVEGSTKVILEMHGTTRVGEVSIKLAPQASQEVVFKYTFGSVGEFMVRIAVGEPPHDVVTRFIKVAPPREIHIAAELELVHAAAGERRDVAPGDTLILAPKTYQLSKPVIVKLTHLTIRSREGAEKTILDGSRLSEGALLIVQADNITIEGLKLIHAPTAIIIAGQQSITIQKMIIADSGVGILLDATGVRVAENQISNNIIGIRAAKAKDNAIHRNRFIKNRDYGIDASGLPLGQELNATENFWGDPSGPRHPSNPKGRGDRVTDRVKFIPFLTDGEAPPTLEVKLVPNPITDRAEFIVRGPNIIGFRVEIFNLAGRKVFEQETEGTRLRFLATDQQGKKLASGVYLYVVTGRTLYGKSLRGEVRKLVILRK